MLTRTAAPGPWTLHLDTAGPDADAAVLAGLPVPATVPGTVHTDLLAAGLIEDPYLDRNELLTPWIGRSRWRYETTLPAAALPGAPRAERTDLVLDGLDTLATVSVDGIERLRTRNMFRSYRVPLDRAEGAEVSVVFDAPWGPFDGLDDEERRAFDSPSAHIRKMACNFGWDWGPTLVTAGIWRPVRIESWSVARLAETRVEARAERDGTGWRGVVEVGVELERTTTAHDVAVVVRVAGAERSIVVPAAETSARLVVEVPVADADLWWPRGAGAQPLHDLEVELLDRVTGEPLDRDDRRVGFRSVEVRRDPDADGESFAFVVNGRPVAALGFNWIPDDCFPHRVTHDDVAARLRDAAEANANILRVWGGGLYESDDFYAQCDELGFLVWQDFAFACAPYPEHEWLLEEVEAEARENVVRLMSHPSLVIWNGNNENWLGWHDWGWKERLGDRPWGERYYLDVLPRVVADVSPHAFYWPGSPYSGTPEVYSNDRSRGVVHLWDGWNEQGYQVFQEDRPRFVSEFGWQGPPAWRTLTDAVRDDPLLPDSPGVLHHQKAVDGSLKLSRGLAPYFDEPTGMADWHWAMQLNQARALTFAIEHFRSLRPLNMGSIVWQLNDCWPVASWAVVDSAGRRRPAWFAVRAAFAPRLATIQPRDGGLALVLVNDGVEDWAGSATVRRVGLDGRVLAEQSVTFEVGSVAGATLALDPGLAEPGDAAAELLVADVDGAARAWRYFTVDRDLAYPRPRLDVKAVPLADGSGDIEVTVTTDAFVRDLTLHADRLDAGASVGDALVTLLPGESAAFRIAGADPGLTETIAEAIPGGGPVLRHAGDLVG
ncbi:glycoside hydrolase family 2 protein [Promicromonospora sp. NPDC090134]|uniref:glycoside hydrolase family 2 protein n=1 Tax=Promicromonospora sp. NPDC090134 TaxID=3364408 RepID=UPI003801E11A